MCFALGAVPSPTAVLSVQDHKSWHWQESGDVARAGTELLLSSVTRVIYKYKATADVGMSQLFSNSKRA